MGLDFINIFKNKLKEKNINWEVSALVTTDSKLVSLGSDSKLIGRIFELLCHNILQEIADENGLILYPSQKQTRYPDFTLMKDRDDKEKIAIDIKTTYRKFLKNGQPSSYVFTLGSFGSYMRDGKKNIEFPYCEYAKHYIIGFIYTRNETAVEGQMADIKDLSKLAVPYKIKM